MIVNLEVILKQKCWLDSKNSSPFGLQATRKRPSFRRQKIFTLTKSEMIDMRSYWRSGLSLSVNKEF